MKALTLLAILILSLSLRAEEPMPDRSRPTGVLLKLQVYSGKKAVLQPVMRALLSPSDKSRALADLEKLVKDGSVEMTSELTGETLTDEEFTGFQGETLKFGTQYDSPRVLAPDPDAKTSPDKAREGPPAFGYSPVTFEDRKLGTLLTITPTVADEPGQFLVRADWSRSWLVQWDEHEAGRLPNNEKILIKQPRFAEATSKGTFAVAAGEWTVLGFHPVPGSPGRSELVVLELKAKPAPTK